MEDAKSGLGTRGRIHSGNGDPEAIVILRFLMFALTARAALTPLETIDHPLLLIEDGKIVSLGSRSATEIPKRAKHVDFGQHVLAPGLVDIHIHGGVGYDVMHDDETGRQRMERFLVAHAVTSYYPTTVTASVEEIVRALDRLATAVEKCGANPSRDGVARPLGIHLEGPYLSHVRRGVHPPEKLLNPDLRTFDRFWQASRGQIRVMTIAPELPGALEVITEAARRGVCVSLGHSDATFEQAQAGVSAGARHATHTFNAMRALKHRDPGILGEVLSNPKLSADIIVDGIHVHPSVVRMFVQAKGPEHAVLITDGTAATGMPNGRYMLGSLEVDVHDGMCLHDGKLAGSVLTLDRAVRNVMKFADVPLQQAVRFASLNAAAAVGAGGRGQLQVGGVADLVVLNQCGEVHATVVNGIIAEA